MDTQEMQDDIEVMIAMLQNKVFTPSFELQQLRRLHTNMCHPSKSGMEKDLKKIEGAWTEEVKKAFEKLYDTCPVKKCRETGNIGKSPTAAIRFITRPGERVSADLKIRYGDRPILYIVDTSYVAAAILENKIPK